MDEFARRGRTQNETGEKLPESYKLPDPHESRMAICHASTECSILARCKVRPGIGFSSKWAVLVEHWVADSRSRMNRLKMPVVDDDAAVLDMLRQGLERDGFEVVVSSSVRDAVKQIAEQEFDVLLSAPHMPQAGDGFTVVSAMRHTHHFSQVLTDVVTIADEVDSQLKQAMRSLVTPTEAVKAPTFSTIARVGNTGSWARA
jgi:CheY-like chemotaxis protein